MKAQIWWVRTLASGRVVIASNKNAKNVVQFLQSIEYGSIPNTDVD